MSAWVHPVEGVVLHALDVGDPDIRYPVAVHVSGESEAFRRACDGLPPGAARAEAVAARLHRDRVDVRWGSPASVTSRAELVRLCWERGASSVDMIRADPTLVPHLQIGGFFSVPWSRRVRRRVLSRVGPRSLLSRLPRASAADVAFWRGVRSRATAREWERLTRSSYVVLYYHRIAGEGKPGQERWDVTPERFERQVRWLRRLGMRAISASELLAFHGTNDQTLPRHAFVLAADDGFRDAATALGKHADLRPYLFVPTSAVGRTATWMDDEPIASWSELAELKRRGAEIGSHTQTHASLTDVDLEALTKELEQSLRDLQERIPDAPALFAYPHGRNDERVRAAVASAGYAVAFTTEAGRNGAGTDPYRLRRVELKEWDGPFVVAWKALTGQLFPWPLERWKYRLFLLRRMRLRRA